MQEKYLKNKKFEREKERERINILYGKTMYRMGKRIVNL